MIQFNDIPYQIPQEIRNTAAQKKFDRFIQTNWYPRNLHFAVGFLLQKVLKPGDKVLLRPPGTHTAALLTSLKASELYPTIIGCLEKEITSSYIHPTLQKTIYPLKELKNIDYNYIIISHLLYENRMKDELLSLGVASEKIISIYQNPEYHDFIKTEISQKISH